MKMPRPTRCLQRRRLAVAAGATLIACAALAAPAMAQERTANELDKMAQQISPPPVIRVEDPPAATPPTADRDDVRANPLDTDGDGRISRAEGSADADFERNFEMMDVDSDGYLDPAELGEHDPARMPEPEEGDDQG